MASPVTICNQALVSVGNRVQIASFLDGTPAASVAGTLYTQVIQNMMRAAPWDSLRAQVTLTQLKAVAINGVTTGNPPPQPFLYEYAYPADCLKARFMIPTGTPTPAGVPLTTAPNQFISCGAPPTAIPFVVATDYDATNNPIKVILCNLYQAQLIYTRDLSQTPDLWDSMFTSAAIALLGAFFINALARDQAQMNGQIGIAKNFLDAARAASANEAITSVDHIPDWMTIRQQSAVPWAWNANGPNGVVAGAGWDQCQMPGGLSY